MKKLLTLTALLGAASLSFGQGTVNFANGVAAATHVSTNSVLGSPSTGQTSGAVGSYYYALFVADSTITSAGTATAFGALDPLLTAGWSQVIWNAGNPAGVVGASYATNTATLGRLLGNPTTDDVLVSGRATGSSASFIIVGWSSNVAGPDYSTARVFIDASIAGNAPFTGWIGATAVATSVGLGGGLTPPGAIFGTGAGQVGGPLLQVQPVPEPSTFALAGLGAATLLIFRRRKS